MKTIKDKFVPDDVWYFVRGYIEERDFKPIFDRHLEQYNDKGFPLFTMEWLPYDIFEILAHEAVLYYMQHVEDITEENIDKYAEQ